MLFGLLKIAPSGTYLPRCKVKDLPLRVPPLTSSLERQVTMQGAQYFLTQYIMSKTNNRPRYTVYAVKD